jgi:chromatin remodeling complex protein RSC6
VPVAASSEVIAPVPEVSETPYAEEFSSLVSALETTLSTVRDLKSRLQKLEKQVHRDHKANLKKVRGRKKRVRDPNAEPSGFAKPGPVSDELRKFLSLGKEETIARTAVTQRINAYCKEKNLQDPKDKRKIVPDASLRKLLKMSKTDELTFFNLQKYMKVHFPNKEGVFPTA